MTVIVKGGRVVDPATGRDGAFDVLVEDGRIARVGRDLPVNGAQVIEVPGDWIVAPGLIDIHVHLREPGQEHKETIATGSASAVAGGFTAVACMPNTEPINDHAGITQFILKKAAEAGLARVYPIGAVTLGSKGERLAELGEQKAAGCIAFSDDGRPVATALMMRRALEYAGMLKSPVIDHCEDPSLKGDGVAHEGYYASTLGLRGIPGVAESLMVERDVSLAELTGAHVHIAHMSARQSLRAVQAGKERGRAVTCEVTPHHFTLTDEALDGPVKYDTNLKMNPPLRERPIGRDAPGDRRWHHRRRRERPRSPPLGRENGRVRPRPLRHRRARDGGAARVRSPRSLRQDPGAPGDRAAVHERRAGDGAAGRDTGGGRCRRHHHHRRGRTVTIDSVALKSRSKNTPFHGWTLRGAVMMTIVGGKIVYSAPGLTPALDENEMRTHTPNRQQELRQQALRALQESEVLMRRGHFDYGNGYHGRVYLNPHQLFRTRPRSGDSRRT